MKFYAKLIKIIEAKIILMALLVNLIYSALWGDFEN
jgi:hypothetical protein